MHAGGDGGFPKVGASGNWCQTLNLGENKMWGGGGHQTRRGGKIKDTGSVARLLRKVMDKRSGFGHQPTEEGTMISEEEGHRAA